MNYMDFGSFIPGGELLERMNRSLTRMEGERYIPQEFLTKEFSMNADWPGDHEGRLLLASVMLSKALGRKHKNLDALWAGILENLNEEGYMGPIVDKNNINEQALSGNSWLMRGMCEMYEWQKGEDALNAIRNMANGLFLKTLGAYGRYPMEKEARRQGTGEFSGSLTGESAQGWLPSTDIGCAFIMLDGVSHAYRILKTDALLKLLTEMIQTFSGADLIKGAFQTHASLSATRGILRAYLETGKSEWLKEAEKQFDFYLSNGITENFANHNWYTRPEWTEPCAIVDSFILASELFRITKCEKYLAAAEKILYNAFYRAQRPNGGFGCDSCPGASGVFLTIRTYEAWWCCSMRGADGLSNLAKAIAAEEDGKILFPFYLSGEICSSGLRLRETSGYPKKGRVRFDVLEADGSRKTLCFRKPACCDFVRIDGFEDAKEENGFLTVTKVFRAGDSIEIEIGMSLKAFPSRDLPGKRVLFYGPMLLGTSAENALPCPEISDLTPSENGFTDPDGRLYAPLGDLTFASEEAVNASQIQIIF